MAELQDAEGLLLCYVSRYYTASRNVVRCPKARGEEEESLLIASLIQQIKTKHFNLMEEFNGIINLRDRC